MAGLSGRDIMYDQNNRYNLRIRRLLEDIYVNFEGDRSTIAGGQAFEVYLKRIWFSNGIHHHYANTKRQLKGRLEAYMDHLLAETGNSLDVRNCVARRHFRPDGGGQEGGAGRRSKGLDESLAPRNFVRARYSLHAEVSAKASSSIGRPEQTGARWSTASNSQPGKGRRRQRGRRTSTSSTACTARASPRSSSG